MTEKRREVPVSNSGVVPDTGDKIWLSSLLVRSKMLEGSALGESRLIGISSSIRGKLGIALMLTGSLRYVTLLAQRGERKYTGLAILYKTCICRAVIVQHGLQYSWPLQRSNSTVKLRGGGGGFTS